ncbi:MAG: hypothetical protein L0338_30375 [Acidobacteria bacterium]|nr:hypothetical protein [Acidobacteriota bacterium]
MHCWKCGTEIGEISRARKVLRTDTCPQCDSDLHACKNCQFYDRQYHNECRETQAEWVSDKERANFCDYFAPSTRSAATPPKSPTHQVKSALDRLFKD